MLDYQVGDKVIHANYGLGEIVQMDEEFIHERRMLCYVVHVLDMKIWVMADEDGKSGLRLPTPGSDFKKLFAILSSPGEPLPDDRFDRKAHLSEQLKSGTLTSICAVIRDLALRRRDKKLNEADKSSLERAQSFLIREWVYSLSVSQVQATKQLWELLETG